MMTLAVFFNFTLLLVITRLQIFMHLHAIHAIRKNILNIQADETSYCLGHMVFGNVYKNLKMQSTSYATQHIQLSEIFEHEIFSFSKIPRQSAWSHLKA